jgi:hypothetical protein
MLELMCSQFFNRYFEGEKKGIIFGQATWLIFTNVSSFTQITFPFNVYTS